MADATSAVPAAAADSAPTRERIRTVAAQLYVLRGYEGFSFGDIAEAVGTTRANAIEFPISAALKGKVPMSSCVEFWAMCIPHNARDKDLAWNFIRNMSSKAVTTGAARNGNGPVRVSTYKDPGFPAEQPLAAVEAAPLARARVPLPAFPEAARAQFLEEMQLAVLGRKSPKEATAAIVERVKPLLAG